MNIEFEKVHWTDGRGNRLMEATTDFPKKRVTISEPLDGRAEEEIKKILVERLEKLAPEYA